MNYYEHHIGDFDSATSHLSWLEDCAYRRMISLYYRTEAPLPADLKQVCRLVRAASKPERDAVQQVLAEFFELVEDGWHNRRCDEDIAAFHEMEPEREAKRENAKERQRRARIRRAELFEALRGHNVVPPYDTTTKALEALLSRVTGQQTDTAPVTPVTQPVTRDDTATHTHLPPPTSHLPVPNPIEPSVVVASKPRPAKKAPADFAIDDGMRAFASEHAPLVDLDAEFAKFRDHTFASAKTDWHGTLRNWLRKAQEAAAQRKQPLQRVNGHDPEPEWRREQRERNEAFLGPAAAKRHRPETVDMEAPDATARLVG